VIDPRKYKLDQLQEMAQEQNIDLRRNEALMKEVQYATFQEKTKSSSLSKSSLDKAIVK
jgi:hypothetical protein